MLRMLGLTLLVWSVSAVQAGASVYADWDALEKNIRDSRIPRTEARRAIVELHDALLKNCSGMPVGNRKFFPVKDYGPGAVGGRRGNGYRPSGYDFYDGNRHGGHPAQDIFIRDRKRRGLDDRTGKEVEIVSFSDGVVLAVNRGWEKTSGIRGGNYIWIFTPATGTYCYYAHLSEIFVVPGDLVRGGDRIATLGRTGKNAIRRRSPTHLHFMCLSFSGGAMKPISTFDDLCRAAPTS
jgi:hypothetical protein